jgi:hypothetical protein
VLATQIAGELTSEEDELSAQHDPSTAQLIRRYRARRLRPKD